MAPSPVAPEMGPSSRPGRAEPPCTHCLWLALPQDGLTMSPLYGCQHRGKLKIFSGTPLGVTKMGGGGGGFEKNRGREAPLLESLEIRKRLRYKLAE